MFHNPIVLLREIARAGHYHLDRNPTMLIHSGWMRLVLACVAGSAIICAQTAAQPGQLVGTVTVSNQLRPMPAITAVVPAMISGEPATPSTEPHDRFVKHFWIASIVAMAAGTATDAGTSWGYRESNQLLASPNGRFGTRGVSIKVGIVSALAVPQILLYRHKDLRMKFAIGNLAEAAIFAGTSVHNLRVAGSQGR
jgi:hypothetical protein